MARSGRCGVCRLGRVASGRHRCRTTASASSSQSSPARSPVRASSFDDEPVAGIGGGAGGGHEPGGVAVVEELRERLGTGRDVTTDDRVARRRVGPVPLDDPFEEHAQHARAVALGCWPTIVAPLLPGWSASHTLKSSMSSRLISPTAADVGVGDQPAGELTQTCCRRPRRCGSQERGRLGEVTGHRGAPGGAPGRRSRPTRACARDPADRSVLRDRGHQLITSWMASSSATAAWSASISDAARWYSPASQSLVRCR